MSSLVSYEDSESEDESLDKKDDGSSPSVQPVSQEHNKEVVVCNNSEVTPGSTSFPVQQYHGSIPERSRSKLHHQSQPQSSTYWETQHRSGVNSGENDFRVTAAHLPVTQRKIPPLLAHSCTLQSSGSNPAKRQPTVSGFRPYIPKRQRLATSVETVDPKYPEEQLGENLTRECQILSDVSARVKPYLAQKPSAAGIPRRLMLSLGGHQGPVNMVQWCPLPHLSHLLLSASMDKTFKVMTVTCPKILLLLCTLQVILFNWLTT